MSSAHWDLQHEPEIATPFQKHRLPPPPELEPDSNIYSRSNNQVSDWYSTKQRVTVDVHLRRAGWWCLVSIWSPVGSLRQPLAGLVKVVVACSDGLTLANQN